MKPKSTLAIRRELRRVKVAKADATRNAQRQGRTMDANYLFGAEQALAWASGNNAMAPAKCFSPVKGR